MSEVQHLMRPF